jgi:hypothetical protein
MTLVLPANYGMEPSARFGCGSSLRSPAATVIGRCGSFLRR